MKLTGLIFSALVFWVSIAAGQDFTGPPGIAVDTLTAGGEVARGLKFNGNECYIDQRTSYRVFSERSPVFIDRVEISFDLQAYEASRIGYIMRIKDHRRHATYNISYDRLGDGAVFKFNEEGRSTIMTAAPPPSVFDEYKWHRIGIRFHLKTDSVEFLIDGTRYASARLDLDDKWTPKIYFGRSDHLIDVPLFAIKELEIKDAKKIYRFPLHESSGNRVHDPKGRVLGHVTNPVWLINDAYNWNLRAVFDCREVAGNIVDPRGQQVYIFNRDSLAVFGIRSGKTNRYALANTSPVNIELGTGFIDKAARKLYVYEAYKEEEDTGANIAVLDLPTLEWENNYTATLPMQLHHHSGIYMTGESRYLVFGGFGNMRYNGNLYSLDTGVMQWDTVTLAGQRIHPRYFQSAGYSPQEEALYIFGGMGNESGEQVVGRRYYYDLHRIDLRSRSVTKLWEIPWTEENIVPVRGMVLDGTSFYTLCYPEHYSNSYLRLYRFSIEDGSHTVFGDSIPIYSEKIKTNANISFNPQYGELVTVVQEFASDDIASTIKIYTLSFPPVDTTELNAVARLAQKRKVTGFMYASLCGMVLIFILYLLVRVTLGKRRQNAPLQMEDVFTLPPERPNSVYLFGEFMVRDRNNRDISYMFSTKLRQIFLLLLAHSKEGITSRKLSELVWPDKPENKLKNLRGVTLNHLRKTLTELDGVSLVHEKSVFRLETAEPFYCDYLSCMEMVGSNDPDGLPREFALIVARGKFLRFTDSSFFDGFKQAVKRSIEPVLQRELLRSVARHKYRTTVILAEALFAIDPYDDNVIRSLVIALVNLKMPAEARKRFSMFLSEFRDEMGEEYQLGFEDLISNH